MAQGVSVALQVADVTAGALEPENMHGRRSKFQLKPSRHWELSCQSMGACRDSPMEMTKILSKYDWPAIFAFWYTESETISSQEEHVNLCAALRLRCSNFETGSKKLCCKITAHPTWCMP